MARLGIVGGIGPESTIDYYRLIVAEYRERAGPERNPSIVIDSIDLTELLALAAAGNRERLAEWLLESLRRLAGAGADFALLSSNTPHLVFDELAARSPIPLVSIVETACRAAQAQGFTRLGLLGTRYTMQADFYPRVFGRAGLEVCLPAPEDQALVHERYMAEFVKGVFRPETRAELVGVVERFRRARDIQALILGGTELPLILRDAPGLGLPLLDTTRLHVRAAVERLTSS